jgi:hypothetical protein
VFTHTRRRWAFVCGLLAAGWREHGVLRRIFFIFYFLFFFVVVITVFLFFSIVLHVKTPFILWLRLALLYESQLFIRCFLLMIAQVFVDLFV